MYPLIHDLLQLWEGVLLKIPGHGEINVRAALLCVSSDVPATRKLCGFADHAAGFGCSKCLKKFPFQDEKLNYSGFEHTEWTPRNMERHRIISKTYQKAKTKSEQAFIVKTNGKKYSVLLELPYFNMVRFHVVDAMHNLLLGTAKI